MIAKNECVNKVPFQVKRILSISQVLKKPVIHLNLKASKSEIKDLKSGSQPKPVSTAKGYVVS